MDSETITMQEGLMALWKHECQRVIADRFTNEQDKEWFGKAVTRLAAEDLGAELSALIPDEPYFVDFLRDPPEPTGDEPEDAELEAPKIYEPVNDLGIGFVRRRLDRRRMGNGCDTSIFLLCSVADSRVQ